MIDEIKTLLSIPATNTDNDTLLNQIIAMVEKRILFRMNETVLPNELSWIVVEATVIRFNRLGDEGFSQKSLEGNSSTIQSEDILTPFYSYIDEWKESQKETKKNPKRIRFL